MKKLIIIGCILIAFASCSKTTDKEWVELLETTCAPEWVDQNSDRKTKNNLEGFLKRNGIIPLKIKTEGDRHETCQFCDCTTGKIFKVQIDQSQRSLISEFDFFLE
ncbi:MAG: hypothetical protein ACI9J3_000578 [Parvicellaceae bacterium]|jgi:hypothetical protein